MKRLLLLMLCALMLLPAAAHAVEDDGLPFVVRYGDREQPYIAITVDDCYDMDAAREIFELAQSYGIPITYFPLGQTMLAEDADFWREVAASDCEIGTHTNFHTKMGNHTAREIISSLGISQQKLDAVLGYHYEIRCVRPPFGNYTDKNDSSKVVYSAVHKYGFKHLVNWDVSETDPNKAIKKVKNGSILLYHARPKDLACLKQLIPELLEKDFIPVTVSELLGFGPVATATDMYVYDSSVFYN